MGMPSTLHHGLLVLGFVSSFYDGEFLENNMHGKGIYKWANMVKEYEGDWVQNKMHGKGLFKWSDGRSYEGEYKNDMKHG